MVVGNKCIDGDLELTVAFQKCHSPHGDDFGRNSGRIDRQPGDLCKSGIVGLKFPGHSLSVAQRFAFTISPSFNVARLEYRSVSNQMNMNSWECLEQNVGLAEGSRGVDYIVS